MRLPAPLRVLRNLLAGPGRRPAWRRRTIRKLLSVLTAALAAGTLVSALRPPPPEPTLDLPVAARDLPAGHVVSAADLAVRPVPSALAGPEPLAVSAVVGRTLAGAVTAGEAIRRSRLLASTLLAGLAADDVAVAVPCPSVVVAQSVQVGATVDVVVSGRITAAGARVLAVAGPRPGSASDANFSTATGTAELLLAVRRADAPAVAAAGGDPLSAAGATVLLRPERPQQPVSTS